MTISVFLADDHAVLRDGLRFLLESQGDITIAGVATDGREAVQRVSELRPDVVLMDIAMLELNGLEATLQIRQACPQVQVIILSMHASPEYIHHALEAGARGYLLKESSGGEVVEAVRAVHAGQRYLSQRISETILERFLEQPRPVYPLDSLSPREREILQLVAEGKSSAEAAAILFLSPKTVETYRGRVMKKLGLSDLPAMVRFAVQHGLIPLE